MDKWPNLPILGSQFYPNICNLLNWKKDRFLLAPSPWTLSIRNSKVTDIVERGIIFTGHYLNKDLTLNTKVHNNL